MGLLRATLRPCCGAEEKLYGRPHAMEGEGGLVGCHVGILCTSWGCELGTCMGLRAGHMHGAAGWAHAWGGGLGAWGCRLDAWGCSLDA